MEEKDRYLRRQQEIRERLEVLRNGKCKTGLNRKVVGNLKVLIIKMTGNASLA